jgi:hypothetical protein
MRKSRRAVPLTGPRAPYGHLETLWRNQASGCRLYFPPKGLWDLSCSWSLGMVRIVGWREICAFCPLYGVPTKKGRTRARREGRRGGNLAARRNGDAQPGA